MEISNYSPVRLMGGRMRIADQVHARASGNLQRVCELKLLRPPLRLALAFVGFSGVPAAAQSYAYVPTHKSNSVSVINTANNSVVAEVSVGVQPLQAAISPEGAFTYGTNSGWFLANNDVFVISTATNSVVPTIPVGVAFTPNGSFAYGANQNSNDVLVSNTVTRTAVATIQVGTNPTRTKTQHECPRQVAGKIAANCGLRKKSVCLEKSTHFMPSAKFEIASQRYSTLLRLQPITGIDGFMASNLLRYSPTP